MKDDQLTIVKDYRFAAKSTDDQKSILGKRAKNETTDELMKATVRATL
jgi:hypothetical protein